MKKFKNILKIALLFCVTISITSCNSAKEELTNKKIQISKFSQSDFSKIHGNSQKSWRIKEYINIFHEPNYYLEIETSCLSDDVYTFYNTKNKFTVNHGNDKCFGSNDEGIFIADIEIFDGELIFMDAWEGETIYLRYSRGFTNQDKTAQGISIKHYALAELTETRMVFFKEGAEYVGEYKEAIIFEAI